MTKTGSEYSFITYEHFAKTYLLMAKIALLTKEDSVDNLSYSERARLESGLINIPVIYCIRHSIELFLKSLDIGSTNTYYKTHDNKMLSEILLTIKIASGSFNRIEELIKKYTEYNFSTKLIKSSSKKQIGEVFDPKNEICRYPDNSTGFNLQGENLRFFESSEIIRDIEDIKRIFDEYSIARQLALSKIKLRSKNTANILKAFLKSNYEGIYRTTG